MKNKRKIIIISVILIFLILCTVLVIIFNPFNVVGNLNKTETAEISQYSATDLFQGAYINEETGIVEGLTQKEQQMLDSVTYDLQDYLTEQNVQANIEKLGNEKIESMFENIATNQIGNLTNKALDGIGDQLVLNAGNVITGEVLDAIKTNGELKTDLQIGLGDVLGGLKGVALDYAKVELYDQLSDQIDNEIARFMVSNMGKEMIDDIISGNTGDIIANFGDNLTTSVTEGINDYLNVRIAEEIFGDIDTRVAVLLGDRLNIVGRLSGIVEGITGIDISSVMGLPEKLLGGITGIVTGIFKTDVQDVVMNGITGDLTGIVGGLGDGLTGLVSGGLGDIIDTGGLDSIVGGLDPCVVSFSKQADEFIIGPFTIDYERKFFKADNNVNDNISKYSPVARANLVEENGIISYIGIVGATLYADKNREVEIDENYWKFLYTETRGGRRTAVPREDSLYEYPYPGEEFYIVLSNDLKNVMTLGELVFEIETMDAEGSVYEFGGEYNEVTWTPGVVEIECKGPWIPTMSGEYCALHPGARNRMYHLRGYTYYLEPKITATEKSQDLYLVELAEITKTYHEVVVDMQGVNRITQETNNYYYSPDWMYWDEVKVPGDPPPPTITLTFDMEGDVWVDNPSGKESEANGIYDTNEYGVANVEVFLHRKGVEEYVARTLTDASGHYAFYGIRQGYEYYIDFVYDGMTYRSSKYLGTNDTEYTGQDFSGVNEDYKNNKEDFLDKSHAIEDAGERDEFNLKFYEITENLAIGIDGTQIPLEYSVESSEQGSISTLVTLDEDGIAKPEFKISARSETTGLYFPIDDTYVHYNKDVEVDEETYYNIPEYMDNVNLGLIKREQGDFALKKDVSMTRMIMNQTDSPRDRILEFNAKEYTDSSFDINVRGEDYYNRQYYHLIDRANWAYRAEAIADTEHQGIEDELQVFVQYKIEIRNQSPLAVQKLSEIVDYYDEEFTYSNNVYLLDKYDEPYIPINSYAYIGVGADIAGIIDESDLPNDLLKRPITWHKGKASKYGEERSKEFEGYETMYTTDLADVELKSGESVTIYIWFQTDKDFTRAMYMDFTKDDAKKNVVEVNGFQFSEGLIDRDSNPGSSIPSDPTTYDDDTDSAPLLRYVFEPTEEGYTISGNVWEDLRDYTLSNGQVIGDGIRSDEEALEHFVNNVKVELVPMVWNNDTKEYIETEPTDVWESIEELGRTELRTGDPVNEHSDTPNGYYKFTNVPSGRYKIRFTYGDSFQLTTDVAGVDYEPTKYNGHDFKSAVFTGGVREGINMPSTGVVLVLDTSGSMMGDKLDNLKTAATDFVNQLNTINPNVEIGLVTFSDTANQVVELTSDKARVLSGIQGMTTGLGSATSAGITLSNDMLEAKDYKYKVMVIFTDGDYNIGEDPQIALDTTNSLGILPIAIITQDANEEIFEIRGNTINNLYEVEDTDMREAFLQATIDIRTLMELGSNLSLAEDNELSGVDNYGRVSDKIKGRNDVVDYSSDMIYENGQVLSVEYINNELTKGSEAWARAIVELAENTTMTADSRVLEVISGYADESSIGEVNLGLLERPKESIEVEEEIYRIQVTLSSGQKIIDTDPTLNGTLSQNVQYVPNKENAERTIVYMDEEIMQGATITVHYKVTIKNTGEIDTLTSYFSKTDAVDKYIDSVDHGLRTIPTRIAKLYSHFDKMVFREIDNATQRVEDASNPSQRVAVAEWFAVDPVQNVDISAKANEVVSTIQTIQTESLIDLELFPEISKEVQEGDSLSGISVYFQLSKVWTAEDDQDTLTYENAVEISRRLNEVGRRDYNGVPGNYVPFEEPKERDSALASQVIILPPFGSADETRMYYIIGVISAIILATGIVLIKKKVLDKKKQQ